MLTLQRQPALPTNASRETQTRRRAAVSAERVQEMLREIAFVLHATRVVARRVSPTRKGC